MLVNTRKPGDTLACYDTLACCEPAIVGFSIRYTASFGKKG